MTTHDQWLASLAALNADYARWGVQADTTAEHVRLSNLHTAILDAMNDYYFAGEYVK